MSRRVITGTTCISPVFFSFWTPANTRLYLSRFAQDSHTAATHITGGANVAITAYERTWVEGLNRSDVSVADDVFVADCVIHINGSPEPNLGVAGFKQMVAGLLAAFPDLHFSIEDQIVAGDKVATRWVAEGTNSAALDSVPATGRRVRVDGLILDHVVAGRVVERWEQWDQLGMMQQLGLA
jgi:predicted ester cyclase